MTTPYIQFLEGLKSPVKPGQPQENYLEKLKEISGGEVSISPSPSNVIQRDTYDERSTLPTYLGNLFELVGNLFSEEEQGNIFTEEGRKRIADTMRIRGEDFSYATKTIKNAFEKGWNWIREPVEGGGYGKLKEVGEGIAEGVTSFGGLASNAASNPGQVIPQLIQGLLELTIEPVLTMATQKAIVGDEILDATVEEGAEALLGSAALPISGGIYSRLARGTRGARSLTAFKNMNPEKLGLLGQAIGREYIAQSTAGLVQEGLMTPEDISGEMIGRNLANPILMATSVVTGPLKYLKATKKSAKIWGEDATVQNRDVVTGLATAKQLAARTDTPYSEVLASIDALTTEDDWISAGLKKIQKDQKNIYLLPLDADKADEVVKRLNKFKAFTKPTLDLTKPQEGYIRLYHGGNPPTNANKLDFSSDLKYAEGYAKKSKGNVYYIDVPKNHPKLNPFKDDINQGVTILPTLDTEFVSQMKLMGGKRTKDGVLPKKQGGAIIYFDNPFDQKVFVEAGKKGGLSALATEYGINKVQMQMIAKNVIRKVIDTETTETKGVKVKQVGDVPLPEQQGKMTVLRSPQNDVLVTYRELTPDQIKQFSETGFMVGEIVEWNGKNVNLEKINKDATKLQVRGPGGKIKWVTTDEINRVPGGDRTIWNKTTYNTNLVDEFLNYADRPANKKTFTDSINDFVARKIEENGWDSNGAIEKFTQFVYQTLQERIKLDPSIPRYPQLLKKFDDALDKQATDIQNVSLRRLENHGYRVDTFGEKYRISDIDGNIIGDFKNLEELYDFVLRDFSPVNVPDLTARMNAPVQIIEELLPPKPKADSWLNRQLTGRFIGQGFRRADRRVLDITRMAGVGGTIGASIVDKMDRLANGIDAFTQGAAKPAAKILERVMELGKKIDPSVRATVTKAMEMKSLDELRVGMTPEQLGQAELIFETLNLAGGVQKVKTALLKVRNKEIKVKNIKDPKVAEGVVFLQKVLDEGMLTDEKILRYVDKLDSGENLTAKEYIAAQNWDKTTYEFYDTLKKFYKEGAGLFGISDEITGYSPHIQRWDAFNEIYTKIDGNSSFIHELKRIGLTPDQLKIVDPIDLAHRYLKSGIHHKAPINTGETAGELLSAINKEIRTLAEMGVEVSPIREWVNNLRGIPDSPTAVASQYDRMVSNIIDKNVGKKFGLDTIMDVVTLTKLGFRPILAARDIVSTFTMASLYGMDAAYNVLNFSERRMKRIEMLSQMGELPQFTADAMLSRSGKSALSNITDKSMRWSFQQQTYKAFMGNMYIHTYDKAMKIVGDAGGDLRTIKDKLGDLLDSNTRDIQEYFLSNVNVDPVNAVKFLARTNAYGVANKFGKLNNPLFWQTSYGRAFGQFGSWGLNAITVIGESIHNSRNMTAAGIKLARLGAIGGGLYMAADAADLNMSNWILNPLTLMPGPGPVINLMSDVRRGLDMAFSMDENIRNRGLGLLEGTARGFLEPVVIRDMIKGAEAMQENASFMKSLMIGAGFKFQEE